MFSGHTIRLENAATSTFEPSNRSTMWLGFEVVQLRNDKNMLSTSKKVEFSWMELVPYQLQIGRETILGWVSTGNDA